MPFEWLTKRDQLIQKHPERKTVDFFRIFFFSIVADDLAGMEMRGKSSLGDVNIK